MINVEPLLVLGEKNSPAGDSRLVKAAVRYLDHVYTGWRHSEIISHLNSLDAPTTQDDQGFIDQHGVFYGRYQAARIALRARQIARLTPMLTSEDLWDDNGTPREVGKAYDPMGDRHPFHPVSAKQTAIDRAAEWRDRNRR